MGGEFGLVILVYFVSISVLYSFFSRNAEEEKRKWGSMIVAIVFLFIFLILGLGSGALDESIILQILAFPAIIYLLYKERTENVKYGSVWILIPVLVALLGSEDVFGVYSTFFQVFCLFAIPAFIIDVIYVYNINITLIGLYSSLLILIVAPFSLMCPNSDLLDFGEILFLLFLIALLYMLIFGREKLKKIQNTPKKGSMKAAYMLLFIFWVLSMFLFYSEISMYPMHEDRLIPLFIVIIFGFPVTIHLLYKERTENIKYGFAWILFPLLALLADLGSWAPDRMAEFYRNGSWGPSGIFWLVIIFVLPAFIIDIIYVYPRQR